MRRTTKGVLVGAAVAIVVLVTGTLAYAPHVPGHTVGRVDFTRLKVRSSEGESTFTGATATPPNWVDVPGAIAPIEINRRAALLLLSFDAQSSCEDAPTVPLPGDLVFPQAGGAACRVRILVQGPFPENAFGPAGTPPAPGTTTGLPPGVTAEAVAGQEANPRQGTDTTGFDTVPDCDVLTDPVELCDADDGFEANGFSKWFFSEATNVEYFVRVQAQVQDPDAIFRLDDWILAIERVERRDGGGPGP